MIQATSESRATDRSDIRDARLRKRARPATIVLIALALALALVLMLCAGWLWFRKHQATSGPSPLEPMPATASVLVPAEREPNALASAAVATAHSASSALGAEADTLATLRSGLNQLTGRVDALEGHDRAQDEQVGALRRDLERLSAERFAVAAAPAAAASSAAVAPAGARPVQGASSELAPHRAATPTRRMATARAASSAGSGNVSADGSVLAVDLWGGKPSVALARLGAGGTELRFINEGESQGRITLKRADMGSQKATFATPTGELTLAPTEQ